MIGTIRALLLVCCLSAVFAAVWATRTLNALEVAEHIRLPALLTHLVEDVQSVQDPVTLKAFCVDLARAIKAERAREESGFQDFTAFTRRVAKWALGMSTVFAIVSLAA